MAKLTILLPTARDRCGRALILSRRGAPLTGPLRILGTASRRVAERHGNPTHDRLMPFGDPPSGTYQICRTLVPGASHPRHPRRFGRLGGLVLEGVGGEALDASARGRTEIVLHGGPLDRKGRLRRTRGGLRMGDRDLGTLFRAINDAQAKGDPVSLVEILDIPRLSSDEADALNRGQRRRLGMKPATPATRAGAPLRPISGALPVAALALLVGGKGDTTRRRFVVAALLAVGGLAVGSCNRPGPYCAPVDCDPAVDPTCPADACDYGAGGGVG